MATTDKTPTIRENRREYRIARQIEAAERLKILADLVYSTDGRGQPLRRVVALLDGTDNSPLPDETAFALNLVVDLILNDQPNQRSTPTPPADGTPE
jgi:hypothetical protein